MWPSLGHGFSERGMKILVAPSYRSRDEKPRKLPEISTELFSRQAGIKECCDRQREEP